MQIIPLHDTNDVNMTSTIAEPDLTQGEVEWVNGRTNSFEASDEIYSLTVLNDVVYCLVSDGGVGRLVESYSYDGTFIGSFVPVANSDRCISNNGTNLITSRQSGSFDVIISEYETDGTFVTMDTFTFSNIITYADRAFCYNSGYFYIYNIQSGTDRKISKYNATSGALIHEFDADYDFFAGSGVNLSAIVFYDDNYYLTGDFYGDIHKTDLFFEVPEKTIRAIGSQSSAFDGSRYFSCIGRWVYRQFTDGQGLGAYNIGEQVIKTSTHKLYQATTITTDDPEIGVNLTPPSWVVVSATNKYRAFDYVKDAQAVGASPLVYTFTPLQVTSAIAWFNVEGATNANVTVTDPTAGELYNVDIEMTDPTGVVNMYQYFAYQLKGISGYAIDDLPLLHPMSVIKITFTGGDYISVGEIAYGRGRDAGQVVAGTSTDRRSNSVVKKDSFGGETIVKRPSYTYTSFSVSAPAKSAKYLDSLLKSVLNIPTLYIGDGFGGEKIVDLGYYENSPLVRDNPSLSRYTIKVRGLV